MNPTQGLDIEAYLERIQYLAGREPSLETLAALHVSHLTSVPFENIDVILRRGVRIDLDSLQKKIVLARRGGYCFEQNTLFAAALRQIGFEVETLEARVRPAGETEVLPRTHMVLLVHLEGRPWLADVGFGADGTFEPVSLTGLVSCQGGSDYRVVPESERTRVLQRRWNGQWADLYVFGLDPALVVDYVVANHFTSTYPDSIFLNVLTVQRFIASERHFLRNRTYTVRKGSSEFVQEIDRDELPDLIRDVFGLELTDVDILEALDQNS